VNDNRDVYGRWINSNNPRITKSQEQTNACLWKFLNSFLEKKHRQGLIQKNIRFSFFVKP